MGGEWRDTTLGEFAPFLYGRGLPEVRRRPGSVPVYGSNGIVGFHSEPLLSGPAVIIGRKGSVGAVHYCPEPCWPIDTTFYVVDDDPARLRFKYYLLKSLGLEHMNADSAVPGLNRDAAHARIIKVPSLPEQRAIAHILGTLDDHIQAKGGECTGLRRLLRHLIQQLVSGFWSIDEGRAWLKSVWPLVEALDDRIELNRGMSETLEQMARALFKAWFVDFEPVRAKMEGRWQRGQSLPGLPAHLYDLFPDRLVDSELGEIPEGWEVGTLGDVADHPRRSLEPAEIPPGTPYIALEHMPRRCIALSDWATGDGLESNKFQFRTGEILFGKLRPYFHKVGVAPVDGVCSTDIVVVAPRATHWFGFVLGHVSSVEFVDYTDAGSTGTKMPRTSWTDMARYKLVLPPEPVAVVFTDLIRPWIDRILAGIHQSRTLAAIRDALLPKLISGELRVKDAEKLVSQPVADTGKED